MGLRVALQMDPVESVSITADSTFRLGIEAQERGHALFQYTPDRLIFDEGRLFARGRDVTLRREKGNHVSFGEWRTAELTEFDVIWLRQDPPFDMAYITATHILEHIHPKTLVVNDPASVRNAPRPRGMSSKVSAIRRSATWPGGGRVEQAARKSRSRPAMMRIGALLRWPGQSQSKRTETIDRKRRGPLMARPQAGMM